LTVRECINANVTRNEVELWFKTPVTRDRVFVLVEGQADVKLYSKLMAEQTQISEIKGGVEEIMGLIKDIGHRHERLIAIRDADYLRFDENYKPVERIFLTDCHDSEMMMIKEDETFRNIIAEYRNDKLSDYKEFRKYILEELKIAGIYGLINYKYKCGYNLKGVRLSFFCQNGIFKIDRELYINKILECSPDANTENGQIEQLFQIKDLYNLCNGHDFTTVLALISSENIRKEHLEGALRTAYRFESFQKTALYEELLKWQEQSGYKLFTKSA
jgi:hypothetical protein